MRNPARYLTFSLVALPTLFLALRLLASFPLPPVPVAIYPSLATLPRAATAADRVAEIYPEDFYQGGSYVVLPCGRVRYWIVGPEKGQKVCLLFFRSCL